MAEVKPGDTVRVDYTGKLNDGTVFDSSTGREPIEFTVGAGMVIPGFEDAVEGMNPGESKTVTIPSDEAYGPHRDDMVIEVGRDEFPPDLEPQVGDQLQMQQPDGQTFIVTVSEINENKVKLDANHPLAGEDLTFDIRVVDIVASI